jgi:hypothetical protein
LGYEVDDRQTAGVGYDLFARHRTTREQRLVEVKGVEGDLRAVWLEQNEWAQAQQRRNEYPNAYPVLPCAGGRRMRRSDMGEAPDISGTYSDQRRAADVG